MEFFFMAAGILAILLAILAKWLGIDNNSAWGTGRFVLLGIGMMLLLVAYLLHLWKTKRFSDKTRQSITTVVHTIQNSLQQLFRWLDGWQLFSLIVSILVVVLVSIYAIWYTSLGRFPTFSSVTNTYVDLGESFLHGQLSLLQRPDPRLVALSNPYNSKERKSIPFIWDSSYYKGKFYLYWGPAPALIFALSEWISRARPPDQLMVLISYIGLAIIFLILLFSIRKRYFPESPGLSIPFFLLAAIVNIPDLFILGRPQIYETSIIAGQFFLWLGFLAWFLYSSSAKLHWLLLAGLAWGMAISSRYNLVISVLVFIIFILYRLYQQSKRISQRLQGQDSPTYWIRCMDWKAMGVLLVPIAFCGIALASYNYLRFGNILETGISYQLTVPEPLKLFYSISYIPSNLFVYLAYPINPGNAFPFFKSLSLQHGLLPAWAALPFGKMFDQVFFGLVPSIPLLGALALCLPLAVLGQTASNKRPGLDTGTAPAPSLRQVVSMLLVAGFLQFIFLLVYFYGAMRFILDFDFPFLLLTFITIWAFDKQIRNIPLLRWILWLIAIAMVIATICMGFFSGFDIPPQYLRIINPQLFSRLYSYWDHQYNRALILLGNLEEVIGTVFRIVFRVIKRFSR